MKIIYGLEKVRKKSNAVVVLGVFDGVHLAHRMILKAAVKKARAIKERSILVTFWPHPQKEESLYSLEHRLKLISELGIDECVVIKFSHKFSKLLPEDFVKKILLEEIGAKYIYVGKNFTFGRWGKGNFKLLESLSGTHQFKLKIFDVIRINHRPVSSTYIRKLIKRGDLRHAKNLLLRPVSILGTVIKGASVARRLGFPTANIDPHHEVLPPPGVYAVLIIYEKKKFFGVCSIGGKPTFNKGKIQHIEVNIFNFNKNIYGAYMEVQFIKLLRKQKKFASSVVLAAQIKRDIISAKKIISLH